MVKVTGRDPMCTRRRILYEFKQVQTEIATNPKLWRSVTSRVHKRLSDTIGEDFSDYPEFEFWFSRFARGDFNVEYDRNSDPKPRSFTDLPSEVFNEIGENLEIEDRLQLRNVCKDFRARVDNCFPKVTAFCYFSASYWKLHHCLRSIELNDPDSSRKPISFVMNMLKHPKHQLEKLEIHVDKYWKELIRRLDQSNRKLHVKNVEFPQYFRSSEIDLHFMIPGVLEEIKMDLENPTREELYEIIKSEQCQKAQMVYISSHVVTSKFPLDALYNCPRFSLCLGNRPAYKQKSKFLKRLMKDGKVQKCVFYARSQIMNHFNDAMVPNFPSLRRYPILGTNEFYELEYQGEAVRLERKQ